MKSLNKRLEKLEGNTTQEPWLRQVRQQMMSLGIIPPVELPATGRGNADKLTLADVIKAVDNPRELK